MKICRHRSSDVSEPEQLLPLARGLRRSHRPHGIQASRSRPELLKSRYSKLVNGSWVGQVDPLTHVDRSEILTRIHATSHRLDRSDPLAYVNTEQVRNIALSVSK